MIDKRTRPTGNISGTQKALPAGNEAVNEEFVSCPNPGEWDEGFSCCFDI
jgi:hypothetical protein